MCPGFRQVSSFVSVSATILGASVLNALFVSLTDISFFCYVAATQRHFGSDVLLPGGWHPECSGVKYEADVFHLCRNCIKSGVRQ